MARRGLAWPPRRCCACPMRPISKCPPQTPRIPEKSRFSTGRQGVSSVPVRGPGSREALLRDEKTDRSWANRQPRSRETRRAALNHFAVSRTTTGAPHFPSETIAGRHGQTMNNPVVCLPMSSRRNRPTQGNSLRGRRRRCSRGQTRPGSRVPAAVWARPLGAG